MKSHLKIHIKGLVQGVSFRLNALKKAKEFKIKGTVHNNIDGSVYIEAEGSPVDLEAFLNWCHQGPTNARIDQVIIHKGRLKNFSTFKIIP